MIIFSSQVDTPPGHPQINCISTLPLASKLQVHVVTDGICWWFWATILSQPQVSPTEVQVQVQRVGTVTETTLNVHPNSWIATGPAGWLRTPPIPPELQHKQAAADDTESDVDEAAPSEGH